MKIYNLLVTDVSIIQEVKIFHYMMMIDNSYSITVQNNMPFFCQKKKKEQYVFPVLFDMGH